MFDTCTQYTIETPQGDVVIEVANDSTADPRIVGEGDITETAQVRRTVDSIARADGVIVGEGFIDGRIIQIKGRLIGSTRTLRIPKEQEFKSRMNHILRNDGLVKFDPAGFPPMQAVCRRWEKVAIRGRVNKEVLVSIILPDPRILTQAEDTIEIFPGAGPGGWTSPYTSPYGTTAALAGSGTATNDGDWDTSPVIDIFGPITNPVIKNATTGLKMVFGGLAPTLSIGAGFFLRIDMNPGIKSVELNASPLADRYKHVDASVSDFFCLEPGDNLITLNGSGTTGATKAEVKWRDAYMP